MIMPKLPALAPTVDGKPLGKLSDFKGELRHLWKDDPPEEISKSKQQTKGHNRTIPPLHAKAEYKSVKDAVKVVGGHVATIRDWIHREELKDVRRDVRNGKWKFFVNMQELTELILKKRCVQSDGTQSWAQKNVIRRREWARNHYHSHKKLKYIGEGEK